MMIDRIKDIKIDLRVDLIIEKETRVEVMTDNLREMTQELTQEMIRERKTIKDYLLVILVTQLMLTNLNLMQKDLDINLKMFSQLVIKIRIPKDLDILDLEMKKRPKKLWKDYLVKDWMERILDANLPTKERINFLKRLSKF